MSHLLSIGQICERALRKIGAFAIRSSGARPEEIEETRYWLDMVIAHQASRMRTWWLVPGSGTFSLTPGIAAYDLNTVLGTAQAPDGLQFIINTFLYNTGTGQDIHELPQLRHQEWENRFLVGDTPSIQDYDTASENPYQWGYDSGAPSIAPGVPTVCYIDRQQRPTMQVSPTPDANVPYGVRVLFQSLSSDFTPEGGRPLSDRTYKLRTAWTLWVVTATAAQIANGPVRKLPADEVADMKKEAEILRNDLEAYDAHEQANEPRRVFYHDF